MALASSLVQVRTHIIIRVKDRWRLNDQVMIWRTLLNKYRYMWTLRPLSSFFGISQPIQINYRLHNYNVVGMRENDMYVLYDWYIKCVHPMRMSVFDEKDRTSSRPTLSQFKSPKIRRSINFRDFENADHQTLRFENCERGGRVDWWLGTFLPLLFTL